MKKLIIIFERDFFRKNNIFTDSFGVNDFRKKNIEVELWSIACWTYGWTRKHVPEYWCKNILEEQVIIESRSEFDDNFKRVCNDELVFLFYPYHGYSAKSLYMVKKVKKHGFLFMYLMEIPCLGNGIKKPPIKGFYFYFLCIKRTLIELIAFCMTVIMSFYKKKGRAISDRFARIVGPVAIKSYHNFVPSDVELWSMPSPWEMNSKRNVFIECGFYSYVKIKTERLMEKPYAVFVDQGITEYHDNNGDFIKDKVLYLSELNSFFDAFEKETGLEIVIACHPKVLYNENFFGDRKLFYGKTASLVCFSDVSIHFFSTALEYNVYYKRPVLFLNELQLKDKICVQKQISLQEDLFKTHSLNISEPYSDINSYIAQIDEESSSLFRELFMISSKAIRKPWNEVLYDYVQKCFKEYEKQGGNNE